MVEYPATLDATYGALASEVRRSIVERLTGGEQRVTDLARPFPVSLAAVSKHIRVLEDAGIVRRRVEGRTHWVSLDAGRLEAAAEWIAVTRRFWAARLDDLERLVASPPAEPR
jgi:DNA-binding transcriptional ArsR family regulator